jgi:hypothetical protein
MPALGFATGVLIVCLSACTGLRYGRLNHVLELAGVLCQPRLEPVARAPRKQKATAMTQALTPKKATKKWKRLKVSSHSRD